MSKRCYVNVKLELNSLWDIIFYLPEGKLCDRLVHIAYEKEKEMQTKEKKAVK